MILFETTFYDYKTAPVTGDQVIDLHRTGMSYYDDFLSKDQSTLDYLRKNKNLVGTVTMMSPKEYFQACADYGFPNSHPSIQSLEAGRRKDTNTLNHLKDVLLVNKRRFPMPILNKAESGQEGLHRMVVIGDLFGWDHKVPVLVVDWADKQRAFEEQKHKRKQRIQRGIERAVKHALLYTFTNIEELQEQLQWELDKEFDYSEDIDSPVKFELTTRDEQFIVSIGSISYSFDYDLVKFVDNSDDELELDDIELSNNEDFLRRYFGDNWRESHPHLKDIFKIEENFQQVDLKQIHYAILEHFGREYPGEGCIFISPEGTFINIYPELDDHEDLCYWLEDNGYGSNPNDAEWFVNEFNYLRCRNSLHMCFIDLPNQCTSKQFNSLEEWLTTKVHASSIQIAVPSGKWKKYNLAEYFPEDILRAVKRYYSSGTLYENLK